MPYNNWGKDRIFTECKFSIIVRRPDVDTLNMVTRGQLSISCVLMLPHWPYCFGLGEIRGPQSTILALLRLLKSWRFLTSVRLLTHSFGNQTLRLPASSRTKTKTVQEHRNPPSAHLSYPNFRHSMEASNLLSFARVWVEFKVFWSLAPAIRGLHRASIAWSLTGRAETLRGWKAVFIYLLKFGYQSYACSGLRCRIALACGVGRISKKVDAVWNKWRGQVTRCTHLMTNRIAKGKVLQLPICK